LPEAVEREYKITDYHLRVDGTIIRRVIKYRNPRWIHGIPEEVENLIYIDADVVSSLIGDPEYHDEAIDDGEYQKFMKIAVQKLEIINELAKK